MKVPWKTLLGVGLSAFLIAYTLRDVDAVEVWEEIRRANGWLLLAAASVATFGFFIRALRWKILLHPMCPDTGLRDRFAAVNIGFMANNLLPARVGEFARAYAFSRLDPRVSASGAFGSLVVERALDGLVLATILGATVLSPGFPDGELGPGFRRAVGLGIVLLVAVLIALLLLLLIPRVVIRFAEASVGRLPGRAGRTVVDALEAFLDALAIVRDPLLLLKAVLWSFGFWLWHGISFWLGMLAFGIHVGPVAGYFTEAVVGFVVALPAAPGFFGTFHAAVQLALENVYGVEAVPTLAFAYGYHLVGFFPVTFLGLWYVRSVGISLGEVRSAEARVEEEVEARHPRRPATESDDWPPPSG